MSEILSNTGVKLWSETDYSELWLTVFDQLTGQGGKSNIRLIDEAIGKINAALDGYKFEFSSDEDRLYISKGDSKLPVSLIDSNGHVATKVDGTTITIDESGVIKGVPVDDALSEESTNPLQNKVIAGELKSIKSKMGTNESAIKQNTSDITSNTKRIEANETAISTLNGTGDGSVKKAVSDGIAEVVAGAPEDFDTLKEMSDWIDSHESSASAMNSQIQDNKKAITTLQTDKADKTEIPIVPTNVSEFTNDAGYLTEHQDISNLVVKEDGKGLSSNDYTSEEKTKLGGVGTSQGRNIIPYPYYNGTSFESNGVTYTVNEVDGTITVNGTATKESDFRLISPYDTSDRKILELGQTYTLSDGVNQPNSSGYQAPIYFQFVRIDATKNDFNYGVSTNYGNMTWTASDANLLQYGIRIVVRSGVTVDNVVLKPMLEIGAIAHSYEPTTLSSHTLKKEITDIKSETTINLLKPTLETITENGVTCTNNGDGTYTLNGTATSTVRFQFGIDDNLIVGKTYKALGIPIAGSYSTILMGWDNHGYFNKDGLIDKKTSEPRPISMQVLSGYTCDNLVFKPMLTTNLSATYEDFVPYTGNTGSLNGDVAELKAEVANNKTVVDATMSDTSTNPVQNKVVTEALEGRANDIAFDGAKNELSLKSGETVLKKVEGIQTGYYVGQYPPKNTGILWIDSSHGGMTKYYGNNTGRWHPVRAKGYDSPVNLINEGYWNVFPNDESISISGGMSAIYDMNAGKITLSIGTLSVSSDAPFGDPAMVNIIMNEFNVGHTGTIAAVSSSGPHALEMKLSYPHGYIQLKGGGQFAQYKPTTYSSIKFEFTYN